MDEPHAPHRPDEVGPVRALDRPGAGDQTARAEAAPPDDSAAGWDQRYADREQRWSGLPNGTLVVEIEGTSPGTVLDVGCGEGADAIWLAGQGWTVTAVDISSLAVDRARRAAADAGVEVDWQVVDLPNEPLGEERFDLVSVHYPALRRTPGDEAVRAVIDAVAPGGTLLVVGHDVTVMRQHASDHGFDPDDYALPPDFAAALGDGWTIDVDETRPRTRPPVEGGPDVPDVVLRAHRT
jgi:SAM-dependent methyltransferase